MIEPITNDEYIEMRRELDRISILTHKYRMTLYSVISIIYAYLLSCPEYLDPIVYLVPIPLIICFYSISINLNLNTYYISSYLSSFSNCSLYKWERLTNFMRSKGLGKYRHRLFRSSRLDGYFQYALLLYMSTGIYFYKLFQGDQSYLYKLIYSLFGALIFYGAKRFIKRINYGEYLKAMRDDWAKLPKDIITITNQNSI